MLMALQNSSFSEFFMQKFFSMRQQTVKDASNMSFKIKTTRRLQFSNFYSSHSFPFINNLSTVILEARKAPNL